MITIMREASGIITERRIVILLADPCLPTRWPRGDLHSVTFTDRRGHEERETRAERRTCYFCLGAKKSSLSVFPLLLRPLSRYFFARSETRCFSTGDSPKYDSSMWSLVSQSCREIKRFCRRASSRRRMRGWKGKRRGELGMCGMLSASTIFPRFIASESLFPLFLARRISPRRPDRPHLYLSLRTYSVFPSRRARYIYRLVSPSGSCLYHTATSLRARLPFALQNCLAATIYVSSDPAAD